METPARPALLTTSPMASMRHLLGAWFSVFVVAVVRIVAFGWRPISPDDSLYLLVGRGVLSGAGPTWRGGLLWLDRSPVFGTLLAVGDRLYSSDVFTGAHLMAFLLAMFSVAAMIILANLLGGRPAIWVSVAALMSLTLWWRILPAVRIDFIHIAAILVTLILLSARERPRWLLAGVAVGISILIKESAILLLGLPVAFIGAMSVRELLAGVGRYLAGFAIAVSWWWAYVYIQSGEIYLITDGVGAPARLGFPDTSWHWTTMLALVIVVAAWLLFVVRYVRVPAGRLLILALLAFAPRFVLTYMLGLEPRLYLTGLVLSLVVVGIVGADASAALQAHKAGGRHRGVRFGVYGIVGVVLIA